MRTLSAMVLAFLLASNAKCQLAITEVMPVSKPNPDSGFHGAEYWELTNFGTNDVNLHGYGFRDSNPTRAPRKDPFTNLVIHAGESIVFFRIEPDNSVTNLIQFRDWWGDARLPPGLQCRTYEKPGLSAWDGDALWLFDGAGKVVDWVDFPQARPGRAFTYDRNTGLFGVFSSLGIDGAFAADLADDIGSPGSTIGPVALRFFQNPVDQFADLGMAVTFTIAAGGMPRPAYRWFAQDLPIADANGESLTISNVQSFQSGAYHVVITNSFGALPSARATLTVNTNPTPPSVIAPPEDVSVFSRQTAAFRVVARGVPPPAYQWQTNGVDVAGATNSRFDLVNVTREMSGMRCTVGVSNALSSTNVSASLKVTHRPDLRFTEVMALPANAQDNVHFGWFELTNYDTDAVDLLGWRFAEEPSFLRAITITNALTLQPGESAIFAERLDAIRFGMWWGTENLPSPFKMYTYYGFGLNPFGDTLYLWNPASRDPVFDPAATVAWPTPADGVSFELGQNWYDPEYGSVGDASVRSVPNVRGAFRAINGNDIASPGYVANPVPRILAIAATATDVKLRCRVTPGRRYQLRRTAILSSPSWTPLQTQPAAGTVITFTDDISVLGTWFYRVEELP